MFLSYLVLLLCEVLICYAMIFDVILCYAAICSAVSCFLPGMLCCYTQYVCAGDVYVHVCMCLCVYICIYTYTYV